MTKFSWSGGYAERPKVCCQIEKPNGKLFLLKSGIEQESQFSIFQFCNNFSASWRPLRNSCCNRTRSHVTTPFIVSLAASDFVFSALTLPLLATKFFAM